MKNILIMLLLLSSSLRAQQAYKQPLSLMGCKFEITVVANNQAEADQYIGLATTEMQRIEQLISSWDPNSQTSEINRQAGIRPVKVSTELLKLIERAIKISQLTDGAFDISYASMDRIWKFDGSMMDLPKAEFVKNSVAKVGYQRIIIDQKASTVFLPKKGMRIGFGAIGKGYAADRAKALLISKGCTAGIINASGDMNSWGKQPNGQHWQVAITNPLNKNTAFGMLPIINSAVVTSGNYEKYVILEGERYAHIIDPRTGYPAKGILSVTVFAPSAELADALATSIFVMGIESGIDRINQLPKVDCLIVDTEGVIHSSQSIKINHP